MRRLADRWVPAGLFGVSLLAGSPALAQGALQPIRIDSSLTQRERVYQLEIVVNGEATGLIAPFTFDPKTNALSGARQDLEKAGIALPGAGVRVRIDTLGLPFHFDELRQRLEFSLNRDQRRAREYSAIPDSERIVPTISPGVLVNYSVFAGSFKDLKTPGLKFTGANVSIDARAFSRFGVLRQTGIAGTTLYNEGNSFLRLETSYTFSHPGTAITGRIGDLITGSLRWTRPIRMGGVQIQRDFTLRSDLVTRPIPVIAGTAAVPSTVDVFVNGLRSFSQNVGSGPFNISNIQGLSGNGTARVVVRDATGREVVQNVSLNDVPLLLRSGLTDYSVEVGVARRDFGILSNDYDRRIVGSATLRHGLFTWLTLEAHAEGGAGLVNGGVGAVANFGPYGSLHVAGVASRSKIGTGFQIYANWHKQFEWLTIGLSTQRTFGAYDDLASVTAKYRATPIWPVSPGGLLPGAPVLAGPGNLGSLRPLKALDRISFSAPLRFDKGSISVNLINSVTQEGQRGRIASLSYSRPLPWRANFFITAFADFGTVRNRGFFAGVTVPLYGGIFGTASVNRTNRGGLAPSIEISKPQQLVDNTFGWRVRESRNAGQSYRMAGASYRSPYGQAEAQVHQNGDVVNGTATFDGSIAAIGGGVFFGNRVDNSFAVVDAGKPGVKVMQDNRAIGKTNIFGKMLVPNLRPYELNRIAIDPTNLPPNYDIGNTSRNVAPHRHAGVHVDFAKDASTLSAIVVFAGGSGKHIPVGSKGRTASGEEFIVGYDGKAYIRRLAPNNAVSIDLGDRDCRAEFSYRQQGEQQVLIDNVVCK